MIIELQVATGLAYNTGTQLVLIHNEDNKIYGTVVSYDSTTGRLVLRVTRTIGSGSFSTWTIEIVGSTGQTGQVGPRGPQGPQGPKGDKGDTGAQGVQGVVGGVTHEIKVVEVGGQSRFYVNGSLEPVLHLIRGFTYFFDQTDTSNVNQEMYISTDVGSYGGSNKYTYNGVKFYSYSGTAGTTSALLTFTVPMDAPDDLFYSSSNTTGGVTSAVSGKFTIGNLGPKGDKGDKGDTGAKGDKGERGLTGLDGARGAIGPQGIQGYRGPRGFDGPGGDGGTVSMSSPLISAGTTYTMEAFNLYDVNVKCSKSSGSCTSSEIDLIGTPMSEPTTLTSWKVLLRSNNIEAAKFIKIRLYKNGVDAGIGALITSQSAAGIVYMTNDDSSLSSNLSLTSGDRVSVVVTSNTVSTQTLATFNFMFAYSVMGSAGPRGTNGAKGDKGDKGDTGSVNKENMIKYALIFG